MDGVIPASNLTRGRDGVPLFENRWWLDAACGVPCEHVHVMVNGSVAGTMYFQSTRKLGMTRLRMPPFTRTLSPSLRPPPSKPAQRLANARRIVGGLFAALPPHDIVEFALDPDAPPEIAYACEQAGASIGQTFTFRTSVLSQPDDLWTNFDQKTRNVVRSAALRCHGPAEAGFDQFSRIYNREHGGGSQASLAALRRLHAAATARDQACIRVVSVDGADAAASLLAWDDTVMYLLATTRGPAAPGGANALLIWDAMQLAIGQGRILDLDGYKSPSSARFLATFGLAPVPRIVVVRRTLRYAAAEWAKARLSQLL